MKMDWSNVRLRATNNMFTVLFSYSTFFAFKKARFISPGVDFTKLFSPIEKSPMHKKFTVQFH